MELINSLKENNNSELTIEEIEKQFQPDVAKIIYSFYLIGVDRLEQLIRQMEEKDTPPNDATPLEKTVYSIDREILMNYIKDKVNIELIRKNIETLWII